jgi:hypothetical protein
MLPLAGKYLLDVNRPAIVASPLADPFKHVYRLPC